MHQDRLRWEQRYSQASAGQTDPPSAYLERHRGHIPPGPVLDVAAGLGRNSLYLARHGHRVHAVDIAFAGLRRLAARARATDLPVDLIQADVDGLPFRMGRYAAVINFRFLLRPLFPTLIALLAPGGVLIFETFLIDQRTLGHPTNPAHLLERGELVDHLRGCEILDAEEGRFATEGGEAFLSRAVARRAAAARRD